MGIGPLIAWRKATWGGLRRNFLVPAGISIAIGAVLLWAGIWSFWPLLSYTLSCFVFITVMAELHRGMRAQRGVAGGDGAPAVATLLRRHRVRYGGYIVHLGVVLVTIAITASMAHKVEREFSLAQGESYSVGRFTLTLDSITSGRAANYEALRGVVKVRSALDGSDITTLNPEMRFYLRNRENTTEVALHHSLRDDLYLVLAGLDESGKRAALKVFVNPLQSWLWLGAFIMIIGTLVVLLPEKQRAEATEPAGAGARIRG